MTGKKFSRFTDVIVGETGDRELDLRVRVGWAVVTAIFVMPGMIHPSQIAMANAMLLTLWIIHAREAYLMPRPGRARFTIECSAEFATAYRRAIKEALTEWEGAHR